MYNIIFVKTVSNMITISSIASVTLSVMNYRDEVWNFQVSVLFSIISIIIGRLIIYFI